MAKIIQQKLTTLSAGKDVGMYKGADISENSLVVSYDVKLIPTTLVGIYAQEMTSQTYSQRFPVHRSFIHSSQKLETPKCTWAFAWINKYGISV